MTTTNAPKPKSTSLYPNHIDRIPGTTIISANEVSTYDHLLWDGRMRVVKSAGHDLESSDGMVYTRCRIDFIDGTHLSVEHSYGLHYVPRENRDRFRPVLAECEPEKVQVLANSAQIFAMAEYHMIETSPGVLLQTTYDTTRVESLKDGIDEVNGRACVVATVSYALPLQWRCVVALAADEARLEVNAPTHPRFTPWALWMD